MNMKLVETQPFEPLGYNAGALKEVESIVRVRKDITPIDIKSEFYYFVSYSLGDFDLEPLDLPIGAIIMTMHRKEDPQIVYSTARYVLDTHISDEDLGIMLIGYPEDEILGSRGVFMLSTIFVVDYPEELLNKGRFGKIYDWLSDGVQNIMSLFSGDDPEVLLYEGSERYHWDGELYVWHDSRITNDQIINGRIDMEEFNERCIDCLLEKFINTFDSFESIDISIGYTKDFLRM